MSESQDTKYKAFAVYQAGGEVKDFEYTPIPLKDDEVEIAIECCGVCHSDLHQQHNDWKVANYPLVVGHEIIGQIVSVGSAVKGLAVGQRVGVGPQTGSCGDCRECNRKEEQFCGKKLKSYNTATGDVAQPHTYGGFAEYIRVRGDWAFPIPDGLDSVKASPLLCAGITTWTPFVYNKIGKGDKVGIIGIGGLGHVAVQFANKLGCDVTAISSSASKADEAKKLGAHHFLAMNDAQAVQAAKNSFDFLLCTVSADGVNWNSYFDLLRPDGTLCTVGLPNNISFNPMRMVGNRLKLTGSYLANNEDINNMLKFCAENKIEAMTESLEMNAENASKALKKVEENTPRFRVVLVNPNFENQVKAKL